MMNFNRFLVVFSCVCIVASGCAKKSPTTPPAQAADQIDTLLILGQPVLLDNAGHSMLSLIARRGNTRVTVLPSALSFRIDSVKMNNIKRSNSNTLLADSMSTYNPSARKMAVQMIFDGSESIAWNDKYGIRISSAIDFSRLLFRANPENRVAVAEFTSTTYFLWDTDKYFHLWIDFVSSRDTNDLFDAIYSLSDSGGTPLYTSIRRGIEHADSALSDSIYSRAVLAFTDGEDNQSLLKDTPASIIAKSRKENIPVYMVSLQDSGYVADSSIQHMKNIAIQTGGVYCLADTATDLSSIYSALAFGLTFGYQTVYLHFSNTPTSGETYFLTAEVAAGSNRVSAKMKLEIPATGIGKAMVQKSFELGEF